MKWQPFINSSGKETRHLIMMSGTSVCGRMGKPLKKSKTKKKCKACLSSLGIMRRDMTIRCNKCGMEESPKNTAIFIKFISDHTHGYKRQWKSKNPT